MLVDFRKEELETTIHILPQHVVIRELHSHSYRFSRPQGPRETNSHLALRFVNPVLSPKDLGNEQQDAIY
jgi:hypothetical protein